MSTKTTRPTIQLSLHGIPITQEPGGRTTIHTQDWLDVYGVPYDPALHAAKRAAALVLDTRSLVRPRDTLMDLAVQVAEFHGLKPNGTIALLQFTSRVRTHNTAALDAIRKMLVEWCSPTAFNLARTEMLEILLANAAMIRRLSADEDELSVRPIEGGHRPHVQEG